MLTLQVSSYCHEKPEGSNCLLHKWAVTAFWLCSAVTVPRRSVTITSAEPAFSEVIPHQAAVYTRFLHGTLYGAQPGPVFSYKLRYIVGFALVEMAISTNAKPTIYRNLYENTAMMSTTVIVSVFYLHLLQKWKMVDPRAAKTVYIRFHIISLKFPTYFCSCSLINQSNLGDVCFS